MAVTGKAGSNVAADSGWDDGLQGQIVEMNAQVLDAARCTALGASAPPVLRELAPLWRALGERELQALALCPCLMLDAGFARPDCWDGGVHEAVQTKHWLAAALAPDLFRRAAMLGWHLARSNPFAARITLGMTPRCAELIGRTRLRDLEIIVDRRVQACRLRWEDRPSVWRQLLHAALAGPDGALESLQLRGVQLLAAEDSPLAARTRTT
jgi:hypothetical protein